MTGGQIWESWKLAWSQRQAAENTTFAKFLSLSQNELQLPLLAPKALVPSIRLKVSAGVFRFRGRSRLKDVARTIETDLDEWGYKRIRLLGNVGVGKTHLVACLVVLWRLEREADLSKRRVVYIPDCGANLLNNPEKGMIHALQLTFYDDDAKCVELSETPHTWEAIKKFVDAQPAYSLTFVYDGWNGVIPKGDEKDDRRKYLQTNLEALIAEQFCVDSLSAGSGTLRLAHTTGEVQSGDPSLKVIRMFGGLDDTEWVQWRESLLAQHYRDTPKKVEELERLTGRVPVYLDFFHRSTLPTWPEAVEAYLVDEERGAGRVHMHLMQFSQECLLSRTGKYYLQYMLDALIERKSTVRKDFRNYDQRYFFADSTGIIKPISDYVRRAMAEILRDLQKQAYLDSITKIWVGDAMRSSNPIVKGFAYEEFVLVEIARRAAFLSEKLSAITVRIEYFQDEPPSQEQLQELNAHFVLWWPTKWNQKYIDGLVRGHYDDEVPQTPSSSGEPNQKKAKVRKLLVGAIQVTLQIPESHRGSLEFMRDDYKKWLLPSDENRELLFFWVVRDDAAVASIPAGTLPAFEQRVIVRSI